MLASEYGWTLDQIYKLTLRQFYALTHAIHNRRNLELKIQASLHNMKIKDSIVKENRFTKEQERENMAMAQNAFAERRKAWLESKKNG